MATREPYADVARLRAALERGGGGLPEEDGALPTSWADDVLLRHLVDASDMIDARLGVVVSVPLVAPVPDLVVGVCVDIAGYRAWLAFRGSRDLEDNDPFALRYRDAVALLRDIVDGKATLPPTKGSGPDGEPAVFDAYEGRMFGMDDFGLGAYPPGAERPYSSGGWGWR